jgi:hypothetical protein
MAVLQVFVEADCRICQWAVELAAQVHDRFPALEVEIVNLSDGTREPPDCVFAVPTYLLDGAVFSLGNPHPAAFMRYLAARLTLQEGHDR